MDMAFTATKSTDPKQNFTSDVCGVNAKDANAAAVTYILVFGFRVSTIEQERLHILHLPFPCSF